MFWFFPGSCYRKAKNRPLAGFEHEEENNPQKRAKILGNYQEMQCMSKTREKSNTYVQGINHSNRYAPPTVPVQEVVACDFLTQPG